MTLGAICSNSQTLISEDEDQLMTGIIAELLSSMTSTISRCDACWEVVEIGAVSKTKKQVWFHYSHMGVSKNRGTPKWMVKIVENP